MPAYTYSCEHCETSFEISKEMGQAGSPEFCPQCLEKMVRDYVADNVRFVEPQKTLGSYADKKTKSLSQDEKQAIKRELNPKENK